MTDQVLELLPGLKMLKHLELTRCKLVTDAGLAHLFGMMLAYLDLSGVTLVTDAGIAHLRRMSTLAHLDLSGLALVTDDGIKHLGRMALKYVDLSRVVQVTI